MVDVEYPLIVYSLLHSPDIKGILVPQNVTIY